MPVLEISALVGEGYKINRLQDYNVQRSKFVSCGCREVREGRARCILALLLYLAAAAGAPASVQHFTVCMKGW